MLYTEAQSGENIRKFTVDLDALITRTHNELVELKIRLQSPFLLSADTIAKQARENLVLFQEMIVKLTNKAKNYASYQERFANTMKLVTHKKKTKLFQYEK